MTANISGLAELVLLVEDVPAAARFYRDAVGLEPESEADDAWAWFLAGGESPQRVALHRGTLLFEEHSPYPEGERFGRIHFAFRVDRDRLEDALANLRAHGVDLYGPVRFEWMQATSHYFYDLDGNLLELWSPDPA